MLPPPVFGLPPHGVSPPGVRSADVAPRPACPQMYRCGARECGWQAACAPPPDHYPDQRGWQGPQVYSAPRCAACLRPVRAAGPTGVLRPRCSACLRPVRAAGSAGVLRPWRGTGSRPLSGPYASQLYRDAPRRSWFRDTARRLAYVLANSHALSSIEQNTQKWTSAPTHHPAPPAATSESSGRFSTALHLPPRTCGRSHTCCRSSLAHRE
jgi:hypothetical protein